MITDYIGQQFGNYRLISLLGRGAFSKVYLGEHINNKTQAAIKVFNIQLAADQQEEFFKNFINEASNTFSLRHPKIVQLLGFGIERKTGIPFLVMSYAPNGSLRKRHPRGVTLSLTTVVDYVKQIAAALQYAHDEQVIHRDVKPENLLLGSKGEVLLSDFGLATVANQTTSQNVQNVAGTALYMAPEQFKGRPCPASDQYALGVVVYEWLCGECPFQGNFFALSHQHVNDPPPPLHDKIQHIHPQVERVVMRALTKEPTDRFASLQDFANALEEASKEQQEWFTEKQTHFQEAIPGSKDRSPEAAISTLGPSEKGPTEPPRQSIIQVYDDAISSRQSGEEKFPSLNLPEPIPLLKNGATSSIHLGKKVPRQGLLEKKVVVLLIGLAVFCTLFTAGVVSSSIIPPIPPTPTATLQPTPMPITSNSFMFGFDLQHTHFNPNEYKINASNVSQLQPYQNPRTMTTIGQIDSSPTVSNGVVYVGSLNHDLYAFNAWTQAFLWKTPLGGPIRSSPAVANGVVYVSSEDNNLYAMDATTGTILWSYPMGVSCTDPCNNSSPTIANGVVYVGTSAGILYAIDVTTRKLEWIRNIGSEIDSSPTVADGIVYVGCDDDNLYAFNATTGTPQWRHPYPTKGEVYSSPAIANSIVYVGSKDGKLYAIDATTGAERWHHTTGDQISSSPAVANGIVFVGSWDNKLYAFGAMTGRLLWSYTTGAAILSSPTVANDVVYIGSYDDKLYAFKAEGCGQSSCPPLWSYTTGAAITSSPAVANGIVYIGSEDHKLYAFHLPIHIPPSVKQHP